MNLLLPPFSKAQQLCNDLDPHNTDVSTSEAEAPTTSLPGQPCIMLSDSIRITQFLIKEFWAQDLEATAPHLWIMSTQSSANVNPLHRQRVKGREIVVTEDPRLHLVWIHDRIFIKPLPSYLMSHTFWEHFLLCESSILADRRETVRKAATGYLRTYRYLIQHESDFVIAQQAALRLVPQEVSWTQYCSFVSEFASIQDSDVSGRYCYGELRLSRLNLYAPLLLHKFYYEQVHGQYADYFAGLYAPFIFVFAVLSTILNSMQVEVAVEQVSAGRWEGLWPIARWFSTLSLIGTALISFFLILLWLYMIVDEWCYAIRCRFHKRRESREMTKC